MPGKIISIFETREGLGQPLVGINLAIALHLQLQNRVALTDFSFSGGEELQMLLNFKPAKSISDIIPFLPKLDERMIRGYFSVHPAGISVLGGLDYSHKVSITPPHLEKILTLLKQAYPYTLVETARNLDERLVSILDFSDLLLLVVTPNLLSINYALKLLESMKAWHFPLRMVKVIINMAGVKGGLSKEKISSYLDVEVFGEIPNEPEVVVTAINEGDQPLNFAPHSAFSIQIKNIAQKLISEKVFEGIDKSERLESKDGEKAKDEKEIQKEAAIRNLASKNYIEELKEKIQTRLVEELDIENVGKGVVGEEKMAAMRESTKKVIEDMLAKEGDALTREERSLLIEELLDDVLGLGCLEKYLQDPAITEIMVNGPNEIYIEKEGKIFLTDSKFKSNDNLLVVIDRIVSPIGRRVDESSPLVDARLLDGSRVNIIIPPLSLIGPTITIRKFIKKKLQTGDLVGFGSMKPEMSEFLRMCVLLKKSVLISGGTGSGKTTLLNIVSGFIPSTERIITIEDSAELKLQQRHVIRLESRPPSIEGTGQIAIRQLVINALRMRPDRIVVGECRGGEALDMLQAMNTGHEGSLTTVHANTPKDAISRLVTMVIMAGTDLPERAIKEQIVSAIPVIVQLSRMSDGTRKVVQISEITGLRNDGTVEMVDIYRYIQTGIENKKVVGKFVATGIFPTFIDEVKTHGLDIDKKIFSEGELK
ncbi:MAG: putative conjugal transfer protein [Elusimicrobia bacterium ADurb.Bin231]|nr:MAG: putative conjugal transfer protein [Elusimicrobia bacterium ADurb.Bin231]